MGTITSGVTTTSRIVLRRGWPLEFGEAVSEQPPRLASCDCIVLGVLLGARGGTSFSYLTAVLDDEAVLTPAEVLAAVRRLVEAEIVEVRN